LNLLLIAWHFKIYAYAEEFYTFYFPKIYHIVELDT
jgi:hypothetical protein